MDIRNEWADPDQTILYTELPRNTTLEEMIHNLDVTAEKLNHADHTIHQVMDMRQMGFGVPKGLMARLTQIAGHPAFKHPKNGMIVMVGENLLVEQIAAMFSRLYKKMDYTHTPEEAYALIAERCGERA